MTVAASSRVQGTEQRSTYNKNMRNSPPQKSVRLFPCHVSVHLMGPKMLQCDQHQICNANRKEVAREQMMASNVSILDTEAAQAIVLLGIEVGGRLGGPGERPDHTSHRRRTSRRRPGSVLHDSGRLAISRHTRRRHTY